MKDFLVRSTLGLNGVMNRLFQSDFSLNKSSVLPVTSTYRIIRHDVHRTNPLNIMLLCVHFILL